MASERTSEISRARSFESVMTSLKQVKHISTPLRSGRAAHAISPPGRLEAIGESSTRNSLPERRLFQYRPRPSIRKKQPSLTTAEMSIPKRGTRRVHSPSSLGPSSLEDSIKSFHADCAKHLVSAIVECVSGLEDYLRSICDSPLLSGSSKSRITHLKHMPLLQSRHLSGLTTAHERIEFVCACLSLTNDFESYRQRHLCSNSLGENTTDMLPGNNAKTSDTAVRDNFILMQAPVDEEEKLALHRALRFGTKLRVVDAIGISLGLGSGFTLLCGYQYSKLHELPERALSSLRLELRHSWAACNGIQNFSASIEPWWREFLQAYEEYFGSIQTESRRPSPTRSTARSKTVKQVETDATQGFSCRDLRSASASALLDGAASTLKKSLQVVSGHPALDGPLVEEALPLTSSDNEIEPAEAKDEELRAKSPMKHIPPKLQVPLLSTQRPRRRSHSLGELNTMSSTGLRQRQSSMQTPAIPRRGSRRPNIERVAEKPYAFGSVPRRPRGSRSGSKMETPRLASSPVGRMTGFRSRELTGTDVPPPVPEKDVDYTPRSRSPTRPAKSEQSEQSKQSAVPPSLSTELSEPPRLLASKYHLPSDGSLMRSVCGERAATPLTPSEASLSSPVEVHLGELLEGLKEQINLDAIAPPVGARFNVQETALTTLTAAS